MDLEKVFNCIPQVILWVVLWQYGVSDPLSYETFQSLYNCCKSLVYIASNKLDSLPVCFGLYQSFPYHQFLGVVN